MKRPILWVALFTICGIYLRLGRSEMICLVSFAFATINILRFVIKTKDWKYMVFFAFFLCGFFLAGHSAEQKGKELTISGVVQGKGIVREVGMTSSGNQKLTIFCDLEDEAGERLRSVKIYAIWSGEGRLEAGDRIAFKGELSDFYVQTVPGGYDEWLYLKTKGYDCKVYLDWVEYLGEDLSVSSFMARGRANVHQTLDQILPENESGIMKAMLTGNKEDIPDDSYKLYTEAGVVHILCISGLHMSCLAMYVSFFMEKVMKRSRRASAVVTMLAALVFLAFTGLTPSAVRAVTMICVVMMGRVIFHLHDRLNEIGIAAVLILFIEPLYLFHIGFQLSFITVLGLCLAAEHIQIKRQKDRTWKDWLKESLLFSLYASLFSFPLVAYHFHSVSTVGILANLVILPLSGLLLGFGILCAVLGMIWLPAGVFAAGSVYAILQIFKMTCTLLLRLPFSYILTGQPSELVILLCYGLLFCWLWFGENRNGWKIAAVLSTAIFAVVFQNQLFRKEVTVAFLDVGQGDCAVISTYDGKTYLVDGGGTYGREFGENVGKNTVLPYLEYLGVDELDGAFLSHPDSDHMLGLLEVLEDIPTKGLYVSEYPFAETADTALLKEMVEKFQIPLYTVKAGDADGAFTCIYPKGAFLYGDDNHGSMVLKYSYGEADVLFTGDISAEDERYLLKEGMDVSAEILKVSHHGSRYSSDMDFLMAVEPRAAIISCGKNNVYGHPHEDVLNRLEKAGTEIYRTDEDGSILIKIRADGSFTIASMTERKPLYENVKEKLEK